ncbi:MAG: diaminopimelate epimerase [Deltaproteobacteria bacterium]|nr:diaminopimelate epimerase [Deltaproteobacteria bacterium]
MADLTKYHALGNDYLVMDPAHFKAPPSLDAVRALCDRHRGAGSDGILFGPDFRDGSQAPPWLRIFNPDGSEAEKSGNGLRIFARYLWDTGKVSRAVFPVMTLGGQVAAEIINQNTVAVDMGRVHFTSGEIPVAGPARVVAGESITAGDREFVFHGAGVGNPHCVVEVDSPTREMACRYGPLIETNPVFPNRTNVQFMTVIDNHSIRIEIWERGAGYTEASGSSSCAAAAVAFRLGKVASPVTVHMAGGRLLVELDEDFHARQTGPVQRVASIRLDDGLVEALGLERANNP